MHQCVGNQLAEGGGEAGVEGRRGAVAHACTPSPHLGVGKKQRGGRAPARRLRFARRVLLGDVESQNAIAGAIVVEMRSKTQNQPERTEIRTLNRIVVEIGFC